jgi:hypothetical protein
VLDGGLEGIFIVVDGHAAASAAMFAAIAI